MVSEKALGTSFLTSSPSHRECEANILNLSWRRKKIMTRLCISNHGSRPCCHRTAPCLLGNGCTEGKSAVDVHEGEQTANPTSRQLWTGYSNRPCRYCERYSHLDASAPSLVCFGKYHFVLGFANPWRAHRLLSFEQLFFRIEPICLICTDISLISPLPSIYQVDVGLDQTFWSKYHPQQEGGEDNAR